ncbi:glycosyltransferase family 39 protein, partial [Staphylococcus aureus]
LSLAVLRFPSVIAAGIVLWASFQLAKLYFDKATAYLSTWLLLTTFYFVFWARVASTDMLNVAGILLSLWWFLRKPT